MSWYIRKFLIFIKQCITSILPFMLKEIFFKSDQVGKMLTVMSERMVKTIAVFTRNTSLRNLLCLLIQVLENFYTLKQSEHNI